MDRKKTVATVAAALTLAVLLVLLFAMADMLRSKAAPASLMTFAQAEAPAVGVAQGPPTMAVTSLDKHRPGLKAPQAPWRRPVRLAQGLDEAIAAEPLPARPTDLDARYGTLVSEQNRIVVKITLDEGRLGVRREPKYVLEFDGRYVVRNPEDHPVVADFVFPFPANTTSKWDTVLLVDEKEPKDARFTKRQVTWSTEIPAGEATSIQIAYKTRGSSSFSYDLAHDYRVRNLDVVMTIIGAGRDIQVPEGALEPSEPLRRTEDGRAWTVSWKYEDVVVDRDIEVRLSGGRKPVFTAAVLDRLRWLGVLSLALFLLAMTTAARIEKRAIASHEYLLAAICFVLFYPLLVFASAYLPLPYALALSLALVAGMIIRYTVAITDPPFALKYVGSSLAVFLGFSSVVILAPAAMGLATVLGGLLVVGLFMEVTARRTTINAGPAQDIQGPTLAGPGAHPEG